MLKALKSILYHSQIYHPGDQLPATDKKLVDIWVKSGSAVWTNDAPRVPPPKAELMTVEPGETGIAHPPSGDDIAGKIPTPKGRRRKT